MENPNRWTSWLGPGEEATAPRKKNKDGIQYAISIPIGPGITGIMGIYWGSYLVLYTQHKNQLVNHNGILSNISNVCVHHGTSWRMIIHQRIYPAWSTFTKNKLENHHAIFMGKHTISISMAIFNSYSMAIVRNRTIPRDLCCGRPGAVFFLLP